MARPRYNPHTGRFELAEDHWDRTYDLAQSNFRYLPAGSGPAYDVANDRVANAAPGSVQRYMPHDGTWHMAPADWVIEFNVATGRFEFVPPRR